MCRRSQEKRNVQKLKTTLDYSICVAIQMEAGGKHNEPMEKKIYSLNYCLIQLSNGIFCVFISPMHFADSPLRLMENNCKDSIFKEDLMSFYSGGIGNQT